MIDMSKVSTEDIEAELKRRKNGDTWFIRELVAEGVNCSSNEFESATDWMDQPVHPLIQG